MKVNLENFKNPFETQSSQPQSFHRPNPRRSIQQFFVPNDAQNSESIAKQFYQNKVDELRQIDVRRSLSRGSGASIFGSNPMILQSYEKKVENVDASVKSILQNSSNIKASQQAIPPFKFETAPLRIRKSPSISKKSKSPKSPRDSSIKVYQRS